MAWNTIGLKNLPQDDRAHITEEVKLNRKLNHPNIVHFISAWTNPVKEELVIITEIVTGGSLIQYLKKIKNPRLKVIKLWCKGILQGLNYLHTQTPYPIIHRDLKCANIFIMSNTGDVKIGDFGLSTLTEGKMQTSVLGTPEYMAPEVYKGNYDKKIDIYSFGMCIIEMCTLKSPYSECGSQASIYRKVISGELPAGLWEIENLDVVEFIKKCLLPADQRPNAEELLADDFLVINDLVINENNDRIIHPFVMNWSPKSIKNSFNSSVTQIDISMIINDNGEPRQISFPFDLENDTPEKVAEEMIEGLKLNRSYIISVAKEIEVKLNTAKIEQSVDPHALLDSTLLLKSPQKRLSDHSLFPIASFVEDYDSDSNIPANSYMKTVKSVNDLVMMESCSDFHVLRKGIDNDKASVKRLQIALSVALNAPMKNDGFFGKKVDTSVKLFQQSHGLKPDGIVTKEVWDKLLQYFPKS